MISVTGTVSDANTGDGLPSATLAVNGKAVGAANSSGNFTLALDSYNDTITASSVGYAPLTLPAYQVAESGGMQLGIADNTMQPVVVTAAPKKVSPWWILAGVAVVASTSKPGSRSRKMSGTGSQGSNLIPLAALGLGVYLILRPKTPVYPYPGTTYPYPSPTPVTPGNGSILTPGNLSSLLDIFKGIFGKNATENTPTGNYSSYDPTPAPGGGIFAGMGATTSVNAGDVLGHTLIAAQKVPLYDEARDGAQPAGYVNAGQPVGIVYSYLSPDSSKGRAELWWMFEPLPGNSEIGDDQGFYFVPHNPDYFNFQALADSGVLTVAEATALKNGQAPSTAEKLLDKYVPWLIGGIVAIGIGKAIINKAV